MEPVTGYPGIWLMSRFHHEMIMESPRMQGFADVASVATI